MNAVLLVMNFGGAGLGALAIVATLGGGGATEGVRALLAAFGAILAPAVGWSIDTRLELWRARWHWRDAAGSVPKGRTPGAVPRALRDSVRRRVLFMSGVFSLMLGSLSVVWSPSFHRHFAARSDWTIAAAFMLVALVGGLLLLRHEQRCLRMLASAYHQTGTICAECAYPLTDSDSSCPECGASHQGDASNRANLDCRGPRRRGDSSQSQPVGRESR